MFIEKNLINIKFFIVHVLSLEKRVSLLTKLFITFVYFRIFSTTGFNTGCLWKSLFIS